MKKYILALFVCIFTLPLFSSSVFAEESIDKFLEDTGKEAEYQVNGVDENTLASVVGIVTFQILSLLGLIFVALTVYAGYLWLTAAGNSSQVDTAKTIMINAIIGLALLLSAYVITQFVYDTFTKPIENTK